jgi:hypothetical protein
MCGYGISYITGTWGIYDILIIKIPGYQSGVKWVENLGRL